MGHIVGISGKAGSGKDTVANWLVENCGFIKMSLADEMKRFTKKVFGFSAEQLWGPSHCRNAVDTRYDDFDRWDLAFDNLERYGLGWCRFLFEDKEKALDAYDALLKWFDDLEERYGPGNISPRVVLQTIGTEWGRAQDPQVWVRATMKVANQVLCGDYSYTRENGCFSAYDVASGKVTPSAAAPLIQTAGVVIPDVRFENEVTGVKEAGGWNIRVRRPFAKLAEVGIAGHASEAEMDRIPDTAFDHVFDCPEGLDKLGVMLISYMPIILRSHS